MLNPYLRSRTKILTQYLNLGHKLKTLGQISNSEHNPASNYMFIVNKRNTRTRGKLYSKLK